MTGGEVTSRQLVDLYLARIEAYDKQGPALNAIVAVNPRAREAADALDAERASRGPRGPLHGIPVLVKDNYETIEMPTSAGSIALASFHPARDAFLVQRLKAAGAVILGKTNMHELAAGIFTVGSRFGQTKNPYDLDRNPGGSSGGTGAAVAANFAAGGMGSDTCGSIRNPGLAQQPRRPARHAGAVEPHRHRAAVEHAGYRRADRARRSPISRSCSTRRSAPIRPTRRRRRAPGTFPRPIAAACAPTRSRARASASCAACLATRRKIRKSRRSCSRRSTALKKAGAEIIDVVIPGLDDLLRDSSMINARLQVRPRRLPGEVRQRAGEVARRDSRSRALPQRAREHVPRAQRGRVSARATPSRRATIKRVALRQAIEAVLTEHRLAALALSDAAPEAGADRRRPGWIDLSGQRALGAAGARRASRIHRRRPAGRDRAARGGVQGAGAAVARLRDGAGPEAAASAVQHAGARRRQAAGGADHDRDSSPVRC